ncbi:MAG: MATE family efflux transporter [Kiritimatiellae bacterium]|nr:MATE family efflux transporter [Kiritimatiellia bacterium]
MRWLQKATPEEITGGSIPLSIVKLTTPMLLGAILQNLQSLIDLFWVGRLGPTAIASVAMSGTVIMVLFPALMGIATGTTALVARAVGGGRYDEASAAVGQSLMLSFVLGGAAAGLGWVISTPLLRLLGAEPDVLAAGVVYLKIFLAGSFTAFTLFIGNAALQGAGDTHTPTLLMALANVLNIILDPLFIFGVGPLPAMGVAGASLATVLSQAAAAALSVRVLLGGNARLHVRRHHWRPNPAFAWRILRIGIPGSGQMLSRSLMSLVLMGIVASCGTAAIAAYGTGLRFHMILLMPAFALGGSAATMMGQNLGAGRPDRARRAVWTAAVYDMIFMAVAAMIVMPLAPAVIGFFNRDPEVVAIGARYLRLVSPFYVFAGLGIVLGRGVNGAGDTIGPMVITIITLWGLQVPLAVFLSRVLQPPTDGIWWAMVGAFVLQALLMTAWFQIGHWKHKKV